jgi:hypothetical protein
MINDFDANKQFEIILPEVNKRSMHHMIMYESVPDYNGSAVNANCDADTRFKTFFQTSFIG